MIVFGLCAFSAEAQHIIDRGYGDDGKKAIIFAPKGSWQLGGSTNFSSHQNDNFRVAVLEGINSTGYSLDFRPSFCYMIKDNVGLGVMAGYGRDMMDLESANVNVAGTAMDWENYYLLNHKLSSAVFMRTFIPIDQTGRAALYVDLRLNGKFGQNKVTDLQGDNTVGTWSKTTGLGLSVNPGASFLLTRHFAIQAGLQVFNVGYSVTKQVHNQVATGELGSSDFSYAIDILALNFGLFYYL